MHVAVARITRFIEASHITRELSALYGHRILLRIAFGALNIFSAVFIFQVFGSSLLALAGLYVLLNVGVLVLTPLSAPILQHAGVRTMLLLALPSLFAAIAALWVAALHPEIAAYAIFAYIGCIVGYKTLYWVPFQVDLAKLLDKTSRGRQMALLQNIAGVMIVCAPLIGGALIAGFGFDALFLAALAIIAISVVPVLTIGNTHESFVWGYARTFRELFARRNRNLLLAYCGDGAQQGVLTVLWPVFIFVLLDGEYVALGAIAALTLLATLVIRTITGKLFDSWDRQRIIFWGAVISSTGWLVKVIVGTPVQIFAADAYHGLGRVVNRTSLDAMTYEQAADNGTYVDEFTALKEMALALGKIALFSTTAVVAFIWGLHAAFVIAILFAAAATLSTTALSRRILLV